MTTPNNNFSICYFCKSTIQEGETTFNRDGLNYCSSCAQMMNESINFDEEEDSDYAEDLFFDEDYQ
jgi:hypothetical protein